MRGNDYNTGLRGVLFDAKHYARMGPAVWLYGWLILRQTHQTGTIGWVLGGAPIHYREIEEETGFNRRTLERWMKMLRRQKYIETAVVDSGIIVKILKAKKHLQRNAEIKGVRGIAGGVRQAAEGAPLNCVAGGNQTNSYQALADGIGSSSVVRIKEKEACEIHKAVENEENRAVEWAARQERPKENHNPNHKGSWSNRSPHRKPGELSRFDRDSFPAQHSAAFNHSTNCHNDPATPAEASRQFPTPNHQLQVESTRPARQQNFSWDMRERLRLIRAERDEEVRRELYVGSGPEVRRP